MLSFQLYVNEGEDEREGWTEILEVSRKRKKSFEWKLLDLKAYEKIKVHIGVKYLCYVRAVACTRYYRSNNESSASKCFFFHLSFIKNEQDFPFFKKKENLGNSFTKQREDDDCRSFHIQHYSGKETKS